MREILGNAKTIRALLSGTKYSIDYYQREYKWQKKQVCELVEDLTTRFLNNYEAGHAREAVEDYSHYFLGSIIISRKESQSYIVDGQQRLTSLTLLLIFLHNLQKNRADVVKIDELIFSERFAKKTFNLNVDERTAAMEALFDGEGETFDATSQPESVQTIMARYHDIEACFPEELTAEALPYFVDWLIDNVYLVEITTYSDEDAYTIFETMNDRGLSLSLTDMLKGFLLANITDPKHRDHANAHWKRHIAELMAIGKDVDTDFFKAWLRSQYAQNIRERKKDATPEDYDRIGTEFHRWVREHREDLGLGNGPMQSQAVLQFLERDFDFYARHYLTLMRAALNFTPDLAHVYFNVQLGFISQYQVLLAPLVPGDDQATVHLKFRLVGTYLDILLNRRLWNGRSIGSSTMQYAMFTLMRDIRRMEVPTLAQTLHARLTERGQETFRSNARFALHPQNPWYIHLMLARLTDYVEQASGMAPRYLEYVNTKGKNRYEVEHIWANKPDEHAEEFPNPGDFAEYRNRIGGLLLLPKSFNASFGALPYAQKLPHYNAQNLLARSLNPHAYDHTPGFLAFIQRSGLPFQPCEQFRRADLDARQQLYSELAERVWDPAQLLAT